MAEPEDSDMLFNTLLPQTEEYERILAHMKEVAFATRGDAGDPQEPDEQGWVGAVQLTTQESADRDAVVGRIIEKLEIGPEVEQLKELQARYRARIADDLDALTRGQEPT